MKKFLVTAGLFGILTLPATARAHYLWLALTPGTGEKGAVNLYFEEGPRPGDGRYLDPFLEEGKTWVRTPDEKAPVLLKMAEVKNAGKRWLSAPLPAAAPRGVDSYGKWGVYRYGKTDVLLHYYARRLEVRSPEELAALAGAKHLTLQMIPEWQEGALKVRVLWRGKPAAGRPVSLRGPRGLRRNLTTDAQGHITFRPETKGPHTLRTNVEEKKEGTERGKTYQLIRHHGTLGLTLPLGR